MTRLNLVLILTALAAPAFAIGCGDDGMVVTDSGVGDSSTPTDSSPPMDSGMSMDTGTLPTDDGNDDFSEAAAIEVNDGMGAMAAIQVPMDSDYFSFDLTEGDWAIITTEANPEDDSDMLDTVVQLFDSSMTMIAENDDGVPRVNTDSEIIYHVATTGTYYARVLEFADWSGGTAEGQADYTYTIAVGTVDPAAALVTIDAEAGDDVASAQAINFSMDSGYIFGTFDDGTDVDVYSFTVAAMQFLSVNIMPAGPTGYGSTSPVGDAWVTDATGATIIARVNNSTGDGDYIAPALAAGDYLLHIQHGGTAAGANDFYMLKSRLGMDNPAEADDAGNGLLAGAEALTMTLDADAMARRGFILAELPTPADVDYFSFDVMTGEVATVVCGSKTSGSGVNGLSIEVRDDADAVVTMGSAAETATESAVLSELAVSPGTYYLRLASSSADATVMGRWVRCGVVTGAATPAP